MTSTYLLKSSAAALSLVFGLAIASEAHAAPAAEPAPAQAHPEQLGDIIVTARKVSENLQSVPVAVTALTATTMTAAGIGNVFDIQGKVPNLYFQNSAIDAAGLTVALRGQKQNDFVLTVDPSVGLYVDGIYHPRNYGMRSTLVDIERLEVLRGPQGTLYGRNTTGGALSLYSAQPTRDLGASATFKAGDHGFVEGTAIANVPLAEGLASRFVLQHGQQNGLGSDGLGRNIAKEDRTYARGKLRAEMGPVTATLTGVYNKVDTGGALLKLSGLAPAASCPTRNLDGCIAAYEAVAELYGLAGLANPAQRAAGAAALAAALAGDPRVSSGLYPTASTYESEEVSLDMTVDLSSAIKLRSLTGFQHFKRGNDTDDDGTAFTILNARQRTSEKYFSQELQLLGQTGNLQWVLGGYYGRETGHEVSTSVAIPLLNPSSLITDGTVLNRSLAAFAQATLSIGPATRLTGGIRYSSDLRRLVSRTRDSLGVCAVPQGALTGAPTNPANGPAQCPRTFSNTYSEPSWLVSIDHRFSDQFFTYAKVARGYRTGGQNLRGSFVDTSFQPFAPEFVTEYEIGFKADLLDRRLRFNVAAFHDDYKNIQRSVTVLTLRPSPSTIVTNAAKGRIQGIEVETEAKLGPWLTAGGSFSYTDGKYLQFVDVIGDRSDESFGVPAYMWSAYAQANVPTQLGDLSARLSYDWQSSTVLAPEAAFDNQVTQASFGLLNGRVAIDLDHRNATLALYARNILNKDYASGAIAVDRALGFNAKVFGEPRRVGVEFTMRFGGMQ